MRKIIIVLGLLIGSVTYNTYGQIKVQTQVDGSIGNENPFLDASKYIDSDNNVGKGLYFPQTDLTTWEFNTSHIDPGNFATYFDGMIVYNKATGQTVADPSKGGVQVSVEPGFYYFFNPGQTFPGSIENGRWVRFGGGDKIDYKDGDQLTGEFFWIDNNESNKKPIKRKMLDVTFNDVPYTNVTGQIPEDARFVKTQLIDKTTGRISVASAEFKPGSGDEFGTTSTDDYLVAKFGQMSTTLDGEYRLIIEYYQP